MTTNISYGGDAFKESPYCEHMRSMLQAAYEGSKAANEHFIHARSELGQALTASGKDEALSAVVKDAGLSDGGYRDLLTKADKASQFAIKSVLYSQHPGVVITSEEDGEDHGFEEGDERFLVDPVDGTYNFARGEPNYSITVAYQKFEHGTWKTLVGLVFDPQTQLCSFADQQHAFQGHYVDHEHENMFTASLMTVKVPEEEPTEAFSGGFQERLKDKMVEVAVYKSGESPVNQLRDRLITKLKSEGTLQRTYSTAQVVSAMTYLGKPDCAILGGDSLTYAWDVDAAFHIAEKAGLSMRTVRIMNEDFVLIARSEPTLSALQAMVEREAQLVPVTGKA